MLLVPSLATAADFFTLKGHGGPIKGIAEAPDGSTILTASFDYSIGLWQDRSPVWLEGHDAAANAVAFVDNDQAVTAGDDYAVILWDLATAAARKLGAHKGKVIALDVSPDRTTAASASWDGTIGLWPLGGGAPRFLKGHDAAVNSVVFSADGRHLYSASADGTILLWDLSEDLPLREIVSHGFGVNTLVLGPEEAWIAYGSVDGATRVLDLPDGAPIADFTLDRRPILAMASDPARNRLAVGDGEGYIMVIDTQAWRIDRDFRATQRGPVWALAFSHDGSNIHAGGLDDTMYSWPISTLDRHPQMVRETLSFLRDPEEMENGERQFQRKCSICHTLEPGSARRAGPSLHGLFGRRAGTVTDYTYSDTLMNSDIIWTDETINQLFDEGPDHYIPGSKMPMQRISRPQDRDDLIAFLKTATKTEGDETK
jgi:cytochrome c